MTKEARVIRECYYHSYLIPESIEGEFTNDYNELEAPDFVAKYHEYHVNLNTLRILSAEDGTHGLRILSAEL